MPSLSLSVLDLVPVRSGQSSADAVAASVSLARLAEKLGYTRYWLGEHHNVPSVASTNPAVLLGLLAGRTDRIRLGSGGVMLPNHSPLVVAEQFALLEAAAPGRIDLGIGRAPGSDPTITALLRSTGHGSDVTSFPEHIQQITAAASPNGVTFAASGGGRYRLHATPAAASTPHVWLLGTSEYSARLAARLGLPYNLAHQLSETQTERLIEIYRTAFQPSEHQPSAEVIVTVTVVVADTDEQARRLALPQVQHMARLGSGADLGPMPTVEGAEKISLTPAESTFVDAFLDNLFIGEKHAVAGRMREFSRRLGVSEMMIGPAAGGSHLDPLHTYPARERTLSLLAETTLGHA